MDDHSPTAGMPSEATAPEPTFAEQLRALTPRVWVTYAIVVVNVLVFVAMLADGVGAWTPTIADLIKWQANFGPYTSSGQWWRLLTCTFVHIGILHIAFNMWVLADAGPMVERLLGNGCFLALYLLSGLAGSLASMTWNPWVVSAGASGAIFGVIGGLLAVLARFRGALPMAEMSRLTKSTVAFLGYNLVYGMMQRNTDMAAHVGGLAGGFVIGLIFARPLRPARPGARPLLAIATFILGAGAVFGAALALPAKSAELQRALDDFVLVERRCVDTYNKTLKLARERKIDDAQAALRLRRDVLPPWRGIIKRLRAVDPRGLPKPTAGHLRRVLRYAELRLRGWSMWAEAVEKQDRELMKRALSTMKMSTAALKAIAKGK